MGSFSSWLMGYLHFEQRLVACDGRLNNKGHWSNALYQAGLSLANAKL
jgi:hypothetical protein